MFDSDDNGYDIGDNSGDNNGDDNGDDYGDGDFENEWWRWLSFWQYWQTDIAGQKKEGKRESNHSPPEHPVGYSKHCQYVDK